MGVVRRQNYKMAPEPHHVTVAYAQWVRTQTDADGSLQQYRNQNTIFHVRFGYHRIELEGRWGGWSVLVSLTPIHTASVASIGASWPQSFVF